MILNAGPNPQSVPGSRVRVVFGPGQLRALGDLAKNEGALRVLLVTDPNIEAAGHAQRATQSLRAAGLDVAVFDGVEENPTTFHVKRGTQALAAHDSDFIVGLGGGSAMDCAKGINFIHTNGGRMQDYWGVNQAAKPMLPLIAVPTTAGTGSEAQSFALITDPQTNQKMACGDVKALARVAILDPELTESQPSAVAATTGIDAIAHAIETAGCTRRNDTSRELSRIAWRALDDSYETAITDCHDFKARTGMLMGAHYAGAAIENSMLGAAHACANPLTAMFGITHGVAVAIMLPHVIRFNAADGDNPYADLCDDAEQLATRVETMTRAGNLPRGLAQFGVTEAALPELAATAARQWTAEFNPRPLTPADLQHIYLTALN